MITSMTGYGRGTASLPGGEVVVELKTLNHRYLDGSLRVPDEIGPFEERIRARLKKSLRRGKSTLTIHLNVDDMATSEVKINKKAAQRYYHIFKQLKKEFGLKEELTLTHFLHFPQVVKCETKKISPQKLWPAVSEALEQALNKLCCSRDKEGKNLYRALDGSAVKIEKAIEKIQRRMPYLVGQYKKRLIAKMKDLAQNGMAVEKGRIETESAVFAKNTDIAEELTRLASHLTAFRAALKSAKEAGRKLDFIAQEMARETNTICQKACDVKVSQWGIQIKGEIDRIREQAQNVE